MIKLALKYLIYEKCIDVFFEGISKNFFMPRKYKVEAGRTYHTMIVYGSESDGVALYPVKDIMFIIFGAKIIYTEPDEFKVCFNNFNTHQQNGHITVYRGQKITWYLPYECILEAHP